jgi:hypothetical protein
MLTEGFIVFHRLRIFADNNGLKEGQSLLLLYRLSAIEQHYGRFGLATLRHS